MSEENRQKKEGFAQNLHRWGLSSLVRRGLNVYENWQAHRDAERYTRAWTEIQNVFRQKTAEYPVFSLTISLPNSKTADYQSVTIKKEPIFFGSEPYYKMFFSGQGRRTINYDFFKKPGHFESREVDPKKKTIKDELADIELQRALIWLADELRDLDFEQTNEAKAIQSIVHSAEHIWQAFKAEPDRFKNPLRPDGFTRTGEVRASYPLFGGYITASNIAGVLRKIEGSGGRFALAQRPYDDGISLHIYAQQRADDHCHWYLSMSRLSQREPDKVQKNWHFAMTPDHKLSFSSLSSQDVDTLRILIAEMASHPDQPTLAALSVDEGYTAISADDNVIQLTSAALPKIDQEIAFVEGQLQRKREGGMIEDGLDSFMTESKIERYLTDLATFKAKLKHELQKEKPLLGSDGEIALIDLPPSLPPLSLDDLLGNLLEADSAKSSPLT